MAAPPAADRPSCGCSNIAIMQLFHELKQRFPAVPDRVVSECIRKNFHDRRSCELILSRENQAYLLHSYPASLKMCAAASEPTSPLAATLHGLRFPDPGDSARSGTPRSPTRPAPGGQWWFDDAVLGPRPRPLPPCFDPLRRIFPPVHGVDQDFLECVGGGARWHELGGDRVRDSDGGAASPRHPRRPASLDVGTRSVSGTGEPRSAPVAPSDSDALFGPGERDPPVDDFRVDVNCSLRQSPAGSSVNVTGSAEPRRRVRSTMEVQPAPHYGSDRWPRSYTSVNLTLRPPSSEPRAPIDIRSGGSSLTYSTSSYDPRQGYQSQLQIRIGPGASGSVTAARTLTPGAAPAPRSPRTSPPRSAYSLARSGSLPDVNSVLSMISENSEDSVSSQEEATVAAQVAAIGGCCLDFRTQELLAQQMERKLRLHKELRREKDKLRKMQKEVQSMKKDLEHRELLKRRSTSQSLPAVTTVLQKVQQLRQDIVWLQEECKMMTHEVDYLNSDNMVPLGETDEEFYKNIYTGQRGRILPPRTTMGFRPRRVTNVPRPARRMEGARPSAHWTCSACTYENHPLLDKCEQCDMPHIELAGGQTQDIHIHVTHHNFPARRDAAAEAVAAWTAAPTRLARG